MVVLFVSRSEFLSLYIRLASGLPLENLTNDLSVISLILRRSHTGTVWFYTSTATREQHDQNCTQSH